MSLRYCKEHRKVTGRMCPYCTITRLEAENAALREEAALYQKEWAILRAEVEQLKKELAEWEASKNHLIDIIHDSTAPFLARAEAAEQENERLKEDKASFIY